MIQIARICGVFAGGLTAGVIGVTMLASATASADPLVPAPTIPAPAPAPPVQIFTALPGGTVPGGANTNRLAATPAPAPAPAAVPAPGTAGAAGLPPTQTPAITGTLRDYLQAKGVKLEPQRPQGFKALDITLPVPTRWTQVPDPNVPDAFAVIADRLGTSLYTSNAQVVVYKLVGNFDVKEAITHGFVDSQQLLAWQTTNASLADFGGFPSSIIEGTYRQNDMTLNTSRRHVIATSGNDKYLVSLSVTTALSQAVADGPATDAIINGFRVSAPGVAAPAPTTVAPAPTTVAPAPVAATQASIPTSLGVPGQTLPPSQMPVPATAPTTVQAPMPNLLSLVPGLPPLPNLFSPAAH